MRKFLTEDEVRDKAGKILEFENSEKVKSGIGQLTSFNQLGFQGIKDRPDGWYFSNDKQIPAIILEAKNSDQVLENYIDELRKNCDIALSQYDKVIGILYNGYEIIVLKNNDIIETSGRLESKKYYLALFDINKIDKQKIYNLTKKINDCLHTEFGIKNLYHRMIFTACALVAKRFGAKLFEGMNYQTFQASIHSTLSESLEDCKKLNQKLDILLDVYSEIKMNSSDNQKAIDNFIGWVSEISECLNSDYWNGEDVMGIFFNEFNRYKSKSDNGQVFTPEHITSFMYRIIDIHQNDRVPAFRGFLRQGY